MRYDLAIFDLDGTLADSFPFFLRVYNELARRHGFHEMAPGDVAAMRELPARELMARAGLPSWRLPLVARDFITRMREADEVRLFDGVADVLHRIAASGLPLALLTSNSRDNATRLLGAQLHGLFRDVDCGASIFGKRSRLRRTMKTIGVTPARTIYIGDTTADADAAHAAGADFGAVGWGYATPTSLAACRPAMQFATVSDLLQISGR